MSYADKGIKTKYFVSDIESGDYSLHGIGNVYNEIVRNIVQLASLINMMSRLHAT